MVSAETKQHVAVLFDVATYVFSARGTVDDKSIELLEKHLLAVGAAVPRSKLLQHLDARTKALVAAGPMKSLGSILQRLGEFEGTHFHTLVREFLADAHTTLKLQDSLEAMEALRVLGGGVPPVWGLHTVQNGGILASPSPLPPPLPRTLPPQLPADVGMAREGLRVESTSSAPGELATNCPGLPQAASGGVPAQPLSMPNLPARSLILCVACVGFLAYSLLFSGAGLRSGIKKSSASLEQALTELGHARAQLRDELTWQNLNATEKALGRVALEAGNLRDMSASNQGWRKWVHPILGGTPADVQQKALAMEIKGRCVAAEATSELASFRLKTFSDAEIRDRNRRLQRMGSDDAYAQSLALYELTRGMLLARGAIMGDAESIDDYTRRAGDRNRKNIESTRARANEDLALNAYVAKVKNDGISDEQINETLSREE